MHAIEAHEMEIRMCYGALHSNPNMPKSERDYFNLRIRREEMKIERLYQSLYPDE